MNNASIKKKKVIIIGAGISGLTAGIYAIDNGFDVEIYEKNPVAGGLCTCWKRKGITIDGCAHWIVGSNPNSDFYPIWEHVGGINDDLKAQNSEFFLKHNFKDDVVTIYTNLDKLYLELMRVSPEDKKIIIEIIKNIENYQYTRVPVNKPIEFMNIFELIGHGIKMLPLLRSYVKSKKESLEELSLKFKSEKLREVFYNILSNSQYNSHCFYYTMAMLSKNDAGVLPGGSIAFSSRIKDRFIEMGGKLFLSSPIDHVVIENDTATGVILENGQVIKADYVISSTDVFYTFNKLIGNQYMKKEYQNMLSKKAYHLNSTFFLAYKFNSKNERHSGKEVYKVEDIKIGDCSANIIHVMYYKNYFTVMIYANYEESDYVYSLDKKQYVEFKNFLANEVKDRLVKVSDLKEKDLECIDVATPKTYERYVNSNKGSYMTYIPTKYSKGLLNSIYNNKLKNFIIAGQWIMPPGGLPVATLSGKYSAILLARLNKQKFINKENKKARFYTCKHSIKF